MSVSQISAYKVYRKREWQEPFFSFLSLDLVGENICGTSSVGLAILINFLEYSRLYFLLPLFHCFSLTCLMCCHKKEIP